MSPLLQGLASESWATLVKALLHTLWMGGAAAAGLYFVLRRKTDPVLRYRCCVASLLAIVLGGIVAWAVLQAKPPVVHESIQWHAPVPTTVPEMYEAFTAGKFEAQSTSLWWRWTPWLALVWLGGMAAMLVRAGSLVAGAEKLRRKCRPLDNEAVLKLIQQARSQLGLAWRVRVLVTEQLTSPAVMGVLVPVLILPLSIITTLPLGQLQLILWHELAHIRRGDYLVNLGQLLTEALLFFNPAVWWISRQIRQEREACCDAVAISLAGGRLEYARTLAEVAGTALAAAPAFSDQLNPSGLKDRIQRLLVPGYRPGLRLTWCTLLVALFVGGGLLFLSAVGARATVAAILSPQQRMDRIERKMTELGEKPVGVDFSATNDNAPQVKISGHIRAADGSPLPEWVSVNVFSSVRNNSYVTSEMARHGFFEGKVPIGTVFVGTETEGFAPVSIGPLDGMSTNRLENVEIILRAGFDTRLQLVDAGNGRPVSGANVTTLYSLPANGTREHSFKSGADGFVVWHHCADFPLAVTVNAPGYEIAFKRFDDLRENEPLRMTLRRGADTSGVVLDKTSGRPIAAAELFVLYQSGAAEPRYFNVNDPMSRLGRTDTHGAFSLDQLQRGGRYWIGVAAPGHEGVRLDSVVAGQSNIVVTMGPELIVRGHIVGDLKWLEQMDRDRALYVSEIEKYEGNSYESGNWVPLHTISGITRFEFTNRMAGLIRLTVNGQTFQREVDAPADDWVIDLGPTAKKPKDTPRREVVFHFTDTAGVPPRGTVAVTGPDRQEPNVYRTLDAEITNGEVRTRMPLGALIQIAPARLVGFWFGQQSVTVTNGGGPMVVGIPVLPAGAIYATARNADGTRAGRVIYGVTELKRAPGRSAENILDNGSDGFSDNGPRHWVSPPLPLGGTYQIYTWRGNTFGLSKPIKLTESNPDTEIELQFAPGKTLSGVVLDPKNQPLRNAELAVEFILGGEHSFGLKSIYTDDRGRFQIEDTTPDAGLYTIEVKAPGVMTEIVKLKPGSKPQVIHLQRGRTLAGRLVESGTGYILPDAEIRAFDMGNNGLPFVATRTDANGRFEFNTLGNTEYGFFIDGAQQVMTDKTFRPDGTANIVVPVKLYAGSMLKPKAH
jgi:beta-lactamase regulating signal transducer with metallopeptidase domain